MAAHPTNQTKMNEIKTAWDLKRCLESVIEAIDNKQLGVFGTIDGEEKAAIAWFAKKLEQRRDQAKKDLEAHIDALEKELSPLLDRAQAIRRKCADAAKSNVFDALPNAWKLKEILEIANAMERLGSIDDKTWSRVETAISASRQ